MCCMGKIFRVYAREVSCELKCWGKEYSVEDRGFF